MVEKRKLKVLLAVRVLPKFKEELQRCADKKNMTLPDFIRFVLAKYIEEENKSK